MTNSLDVCKSNLAVKIFFDVPQRLLSPHLHLRRKEACAQTNILSFLWRVEIFLELIRRRRRSTAWRGGYGGACYNLIHNLGRN